MPDILFTYYLLPTTYYLLTTNVLIGHEELQKEFRALADNGNLAQGYIFYGPARVGKFSFARALANYFENKVFKKESIAPLGDALVVGPGEGNSIGIDRAREIKKFLWQKPNRSSRRMVVIDRAELLTDEAQNTLLKTTEEPPASGALILVTEDPESLRPTLQSRLRKIYFGPVQLKKIEKWLQSELGVDKEKSAELAEKSLGLPGLAAELGDKNSGLVRRLGQAAKYLKLNGAARSAFVKEMLEDESFRLDDFLEALAMHSAQSGYRQPRFWHHLLELRRQAGYFNLNPRIQLSALAKCMDN